MGERVIKRRDWTHKKLSEQDILEEQPTNDVYLPISNLAAIIGVSNQTIRLQLGHSCKFYKPKGGVVMVCVADAFIYYNYIPDDDELARYHLPENFRDNLDL